MYTYMYIYIYTHIQIYIHIHIYLAFGFAPLRRSRRPFVDYCIRYLRPIVILIILRPRIVESKFRNHCAKELDGALRKPTSFV